MKTQRNFLAMPACLMALAFTALSLTGCKQPSGPDPHVHQWGEWAITSAATCTTEGVETRVCALDATHKETRAGAAALGHDWGDWGTPTPATETEDGKETRTCTHDPSHKENRFSGEYATGTVGLEFNLFDTIANDEYNVSGTYAVSKGTVTGGVVHIPAMHRPEGSTSFDDYKPVTVIQSEFIGYNSSTQKYEGAFSQTNITAIHIPASLKVIASLSFYECENLATVTIAEDSQLKTIGSEAFTCCTSLAAIILPTGLTRINAYAFSEAGLTGITIPTSVAHIGEGAFSWTNITEISIPAGIASINDYTFRSCANLAKVTLPASVTSIGEYAFAYCPSLSEINIPAGVLSIGEEAFNGCAFTEFTIPAGVATINKSTFFNCRNLTHIIIPEGVETIGNNVFYNCTSLADITIPASVTSIGTGVFYNCTSLAGITVNAGNPNYSSESGILYNHAKTTLFKAPAAGISGVVIIHPNVTSIDQYAFQDCTGITEMTVPSIVTSVGASAFRNWTASQTIYIQGHANQAAADAAWPGLGPVAIGNNWRTNCNAVIKYWNGSEYQ